MLTMLKAYARMSCLAWIACGGFALLFMFSQRFGLNARFAYLSIAVEEGRAGLSVHNFDESRCWIYPDGRDDPIHWQFKLPKLIIETSQPGLQRFFYYGVYSPLWFPIAISFVVAVIASRRARRKRRLLDLCYCGYVLRGNVSGKCSECGRPVSLQGHAGAPRAGLAITVALGGVAVLLLDLLFNDHSLLSGGLERSWPQIAFLLELSAIVISFIRVAGRVSDRRDDRLLFSARLIAFVLAGLLIVLLEIVKGGL